MDTLTKALTADLHSPNKRRREAALDRIRALPEEDAIKMLIALMNPSDHQSRSWIIDLVVPMPVTIVLCVSINPFSPIGAALNESIFLFSSCMMVCILISIGLGRKLSGKTEWVTPLLPHYSDTRLITPCLSEWKASQGKKRGFLEACLVRNLPRLTPEIAEKMAMEKRKQLRELVFVESLALQCVTLQTLLQIEDVNAIPNVETLLKNTPNSEVQEAAEACLSGLRELKQREKDREVLLRPSLEKNGKEVLLRPATSRHDEDEQQLLRPGSGEE